VAGCVQQLLLEGLHVVGVHVRITASVHKLTRAQVAHLRRHSRRQRVTQK
jgi:hypothetical protein